MLNFFKKNLKLIIIIVVLVIIATVAGRFFIKKDALLNNVAQPTVEENNNNDKPNLAEEKAANTAVEEEATSTSVEVEAISLSDLESVVEFEGTAKPSQNTTIRAGQSGYVEKILVQEGDNVKAGQALIYIDRVVSQNRYSLALNGLKSALLDVYQAESGVKANAYAFLSLEKDLNSAAKGLESEQALFDQGLSSNTKFNNMQSMYNNLMSRYQSANVNLNGADIEEIKKLDLINYAKDFLKNNSNIEQLTFKTSMINTPIDLQRALIRFEVEKSNYLIAKDNYDKSRGKAPFNGHVLHQLVENGQYVNPGEGLFVFGNIENFDISVYITANDLQSINREEEALVRFDSIPNQTFTGKIKTVALAANSSNFGYRVLITVKNIDNKIYSGDRANVKLKIVDQASRLSVPLPAILQAENNPYVFVVDDANIAHRRDIKVGSILGDRIIVEEGLSVGDQVVIKSQQFLKDNDKVLIK